MKRRRENDGENRAGSSGRNEAGCSDSKLDDDVSEDMLAKSNDPPSNDGGDMSDPELEPKHEIFLSHSGRQKGFTELLEKELVRCGYCPFFDIRSDSLPKGKRFPELIFSAGRQCRVAVLILSEDFFNSKWPMLELATFVDAQKRRREEKRLPLDILPVYFKLTRNECRMDENLQRWQKRWEQLEMSDLAKELNAVKILEMDKKLNEDERAGASILDEGERADIQAQMQIWYKKERGERYIRALQWKDAMNVLGPANGINMPSLREAQLIDGVVKEVRGLLPPPIMSSDPGIKAKRRICKRLKDMISGTEASPNGARVVGVYGMGGMGKTTFCKEMCVEYFKEFGGKVCHAELGSLSESELQKKVLRKLTDVNHSSLSLAEDSKVTDYVRTRMVGEKVFLALDDVWPESKGEAMVYVEQAQYGKGSIVMVTARSIDVLCSLGIRSCFAMPELDVEDARLLFLHHAAPNFLYQGGEDEECIRRCVQECYFSRGGEDGWHFLPLALKVLGELMHGMGENPREWVERLSMNDKFDLDRRKEHPLYFILGRGYDLLRLEDQLLFMDIILCNPHWKPKFNPPELWTLFEWLSIVHYGTTSEVSSIKIQLQRLKARALVEDIGDGRRSVVVHDLYRDFAKFEASRVDWDARRVVWHGEISDLPMDLVKKPSGNCWSHVERVGIESDRSLYYSRRVVTLDGVKWKHFANVVVLVIRINAHDQVLDLHELQCLRSLVVVAREFTISGLGKMRNLGWLELDGVYCGPDLEKGISRLTKLQMLRVKSWCSRDLLIGTVLESCAFPGGRLNLEKCTNLRQLVVHYGCFQALPDLGGMKFLRNVEFLCPRVTEGPGGLGSQLCALQELSLDRCWSLHDPLPRLHEVVSLQILVVESLLELEVFPAISMLTRLRILKIINLPKIVLVPGLGELVALENLILDSLPKVRELPDMRSLTKLHNLILDSLPKVRELPDMRSLTKLDNLVLANLPKVRELPDMRSLTKLHNLILDSLPKVRELPDMRSLTQLDNLVLANLPKVRELPDMRSLTKLEYLRLESLSKVREVPDMRSLTKLYLMKLVGVGEVWEQLQLLDRIPSQLRYLSASDLDPERSCMLTSENVFVHSPKLDLHGLYKRSRFAYVLRDIRPEYPNWCVPKML